MMVSLKVRKRPGRAKPRVRRLVFYYRKASRGKRVVARTDRRAPYRRSLRIHLAPGPAQGLRPRLLPAAGWHESAKQDRVAALRGLRLSVSRPCRS